MESLVPLALLVLLIAAVAPGIYALRKRLGQGGRRLELWRMLHRRGLTADDALGEPRPLAMALRRCALCPSVEECRHWLASDAREGFEAFCPNSRYIERLERE
jgi:hypothetical protein